MRNQGPTRSVHACEQVPQLDHGQHAALELEVDKLIRDSTRPDDQSLYLSVCPRWLHPARTPRDQQWRLAISCPPTSARTASGRAHLSYSVVLCPTLSLLCRQTTERLSSPLAQSVQTMYSLKMLSRTSLRHFNERVSHICIVSSTRTCVLPNTHPMHLLSIECLYFLM